jgi:hypothetical protein
MIMSSVPESTVGGEPADPKPAVERPEPLVKGPDTESLMLAPLRSWILALGAAVIAGLLTWAVGEKTYGHYRPPKEAYKNRFAFAEVNRHELVADRKNGAIAFGTFGACLGLLGGAAGGLERRSMRALVIAAPAGLVSAGLLGGVAGYALAPMVPQFYDDKNPTIVLPVLVRGGIVAAVGLAAGLAFGLGREGPRGLLRPLAGGLIGSVLGIVAVEVIYALAFPMVRNDHAIPLSATTRLLCYLCVAIGAAVGMLLMDLDRARPERAVRTPAEVAG